MKTYYYSKKSYYIYKCFVTRYHDTILEKTYNRAAQCNIYRIIYSKYKNDIGKTFIDINPIFIYKIDIRDLDSSIQMEILINM